MSTINESLNNTVLKEPEKQDLLEGENRKPELQSKPEPPQTSDGLIGEQNKIESALDIPPERTRICPRCGKVIAYGSKYLANAAKKRGAVCRSCSKTFDRDTRFWALVDRKGPDECWEWVGERSPNGYGRFAAPKNGGHAQLSNRVAWEISNGSPVPDDYVALLTCGNHACCNPVHIRIEPRGEFSRRMHTKPIDNSPVFRTCPKCGKQIQCGSKAHKRKAERGGWTCTRCARLESVDVKFWRNVDKNGPNGCWIWTGNINSTGYGVIGHTFDTGRHAHLLAHRVSWELHNGPIPDGLLACHKCDNPPCCNPDHIFLGTYADNTHDMVMKGRGNNPKGEDVVFSKLNDENVRFIRSSTLNNQQLSRMFNVSDSAISSARLGRTWKHVK